jgi:ABC-type spermidine/putrescine transport system permease subunit II
MSRATTMERWADRALGLVTCLVLLALYAPVAVVVLFSFVPYRQRHIIWDEATLEWYVRLAQNLEIRDAIANSLLVGVASVALALIVAVISAFYVQSERAFARGVLEALILLPFLLPPIVTGLSLLIFLQQSGVERGLTSIVLGHAAFLLALTYRIVLTRLRALPRSLIEASYDLGATTLQTLRHVILPHLASALIAAALLAFTLSIDETLITIFLAGDEMTLPLRLWAKMRVGFTPEVNALGTLVLLISAILTIGLAWRLRHRAIDTDD